MSNELPVNESVKGVKKPARMYATSFCLLAKGKRFVYRGIPAIKTSAYEAVLLKSGKLVKLAADKSVKVRP